MKGKPNMPMIEERATLYAQVAATLLAGELRGVTANEELPAHLEARVSVALEVSRLLVAGAEKMTAQEGRDKMKR